jgi:hypothetical protein
MRRIGWLSLTVLLLGGLSLVAWRCFMAERPSVAAEVTPVAGLQGSAAMYLPWISHGQPPTPTVNPAPSATRVVASHAIAAEAATPVVRSPAQPAATQAVTAPPARSSPSRTAPARWARPAATRPAIGPTVRLMSPPPRVTAACPDRACPDDAEPCSCP